MLRSTWLAFFLIPAPVLAAGGIGYDQEAVEEAKGSDEVAATYSSSRAYEHYLQAKIAEMKGDLVSALILLKQAALYDEESEDLRLGIARLHLKAGRRAEAIGELEALVRKAPANSSAHMMLGIARSMEGKLPEAASSFMNAIRADPDFEDPYLVLIKIRADQGAWVEAERLAEELSGRRPGEGKAWRILAYLAREKGNGALELKFLRRAVALEPGHLSSVRELAAREEEVGRFDEALQGYGQVLRWDPTDTMALLGSARIALRRGDETLARAYLRQLFGTHPDPVGVRLQTALDLERARRSESALEVLAEANSLSSDPRIPFFRGLVLEGRREYRKAAEAFRQVPATAGHLYPLSRARWAVCLSMLGSPMEGVRILELARATAERLFDEGVLGEVLRSVPEVYRRAGRSPEAVDLLRQASQRMPSSQAVAIALASALLDTGQSEEAIRLLTTMVEWADEPEDATLFALAVAKERAGDPEGAVSVAARILEVSPENPSVLNFMGYVLADHGIRLDEARALLVRAVELRPEDPAFLDSLGWCEFKRGDFAAAEPYLQSAAEMLPDDPEILHHLAELYFRTERQELAVATWQRALQALHRDPDFRLRVIIEKRLGNAQRSVTDR